jgi:hypothetical protein
MGKFLLRVILIAGLAYLGQLYLPFWIAAVAAFLVGFLLSNNPPKRRSFSRKKTKSFSFLAGFLALLLLWGGTGAFARSLQ